MPFTDVEVFGERLTIKHDRDEEYIKTLAGLCCIIRNATNSSSLERP
jgi:hypothetical protein